MINPQVSIIVPIYQAQKYVRKCLESLLKQTLKDIEIICVDDCGRDSSMQIVEEIANKDTRIRIFKQDRNRGLSAARNLAMDHARAPFVMFCDSDDYYEHNMCEKMVNALVGDPRADMAMCKFSLFYEYDMAAPESFNSHSLLGFRKLNRYAKSNTRTHVWCRIYRRDFLEKYHIRFPDGLTFEDWYFYHICAEHARGIVYLPDMLYRYRRHKSSITHVKQKWGVDYLPIGLHLWEYSKNQGWLEKENAYLLGICAQLFDYGIYYSSKKERTHALNLIREFIKKEGFTRESLPLPLVNVLSKYLGKSVVKKWRCGGLVRYRESFWEKVLRVFGIPVYRQKFKFDEIKTRCLFSHKTERISGEVFKPYPIDNAELLKELRALGTFTFIPSPGNMSELLSTAATLKFFESHSLKYLMYKDWMNRDNIVFGGGDFWSKEDMSVWEEFLPVFQDACRIVIMPSSFYDCEAIFKVLDERFTVFCRDEASYRYLSARYTGAKIILDHDMSLRLNASFVTSPVAAVKNPNKCYNALRRLISNSSDIVYFLSEELSRSGFDLINIAYIDSSTRKEDIYFHAKFLLCIVSFYSVVVTDCPHIGIAAALMGREVYLVGDKCKEIYNHSLVVYPFVHYVEQIPQNLVSSETYNPNRKIFDLLSEHFRVLHEGRAEAYDVLIKE